MDNQPRSPDYFIKRDDTPDEPQEPKTPAEKQAAAQRQARQLILDSAIFLDTETCGFAKTDTFNGEICSIALVDRFGALIFKSLVRPFYPIELSATMVHGISDAHVLQAPRFSDIWPALFRILDGNPVVAYNADFDKRAMIVSAKAAALPLGTDEIIESWEWNCAQKMYHRFAGKKDKLTNAAKSFGVAVKENHHADVDAELAWHVVSGIATQEPPLVIV